MSEQEGLSKAIEAYRILGLPLQANLQECRQARNRLLQKFHPDKWPNPPQDANPHLQTRLVQEAYRFILEHYPQIQEWLSPFREAPLSTQMPKAQKSHWAYQQVSSWVKKDT